MAYRNASDVLPDELLREVQKYAAGETLYFPTGKGRREWGEGSGARAYFRARNEEIREQYAKKKSIDHLAEEYCLSAETVRKIIFGH